MLEQLLKSPIAESPITVDSINIDNQFTHGTKGRVNTEAAFNFNLSDDNKKLLVSLTLKIIVIPEGSDTPVQLACLKSHCGFETQAAFPKEIASNEKDMRYFGFPLLQRSSQILDTTFRLMNLVIPIPMCQLPVTRTVRQ